jgi:hypothetical protein
MDEAQVRSLEQVRQVLEGTQSLEFRRDEDDEGRYAWIELVDTPRRRAAPQPPNRPAQIPSRLIPHWNHEPGSRLIPHWTRLYMAALVATRYNPVIKAFYQRRSRRANPRSSPSPPAHASY